MKIYTLTEIDGFEWVAPEAAGDFASFRALDGTPHAARWVPVEVKLIGEDDDGRPLAESGFPWMGSHVLFLRDEAVRTAGPVLEPYGELLPLSCDTADLKVFNAGLVLDALDEDASDIVRFSSGRVMDVNRYRFRAGLIPERAAFKLPQTPAGHLFFTEALVRDLEQVGLPGLGFTAIWDSTPGSTGK